MKKSELIVLTLTPEQRDNTLKLMKVGVGEAVRYLQRIKKTATTRELLGTIGVLRDANFLERMKRDA